MAAGAVMWLVPTTTRLGTDCPICGWADLWHVTVHTLSASGVGVAAEMIRCARCTHDR